MKRWIASVLIAFLLWAQPVLGLGVVLAQTTSIPLPPDNPPLFANDSGNVSDISVACGKVGWIWSQRGSQPLNVPVAGLGRCAKQARYWPSIRFEVYADTDPTETTFYKLTSWFMTNHPDWIMFQRPVQFTIAVTGGSASFTGASVNLQQPITWGASGVGPGSVACTTTIDCNQHTLSYASGFNEASWLTDTGGCMPAGTQLASILSASAGTLSNPVNSIGGCTGTITVTAYTPAYYAAQDSYPPIAFFDPAFQQWEIGDGPAGTGCPSQGSGMPPGCSLLGMIQSGLQQIDYDNWGVRNSMAEYGRMRGTTVPCAPAAMPFCGGTLEVEFAATALNGTVNDDPSYAFALTQWLARVGNALHAHGALLAINITMIDGTAQDVPLIQFQGNLADIDLVESPTNLGCVGATQTLRTLGRNWAYQDTVLQGITAALAWDEDSAGLNYSGSGTPSCPPNPTVTAEDGGGAGGAEDYALANFLLYAQPGKAWFAMTGTSDISDIVTPATSYMAALGLLSYPAGPRYQNSGGAYERDWIGRGMVVVNPNDPAGASDTYVIPAPNPGYSWQDNHGNAVTAGAYTLGPASARVFLQVP